MDISSHFVLIFVLLCLIFINFSFTQNVDSCISPRGQSGECILITTCQSLFSILQHRPISSANADYLRRSQCGFQGTLPKVCCPFENEAPVTRPTTPVYVEPTESTSGPPGGDDDRITGEEIKTNLLPSRDVCGTDSQNRIYGGEATNLEEFPWMTLIEYERPNKARGFYCGGVLISKNYVLTAAHCVKGKDLPKDWKLISVRLGEYNTDTEKDCLSLNSKRNITTCAPAPQNIYVEERIAHEDYDPYDKNQYHDIALIRLVRDAEYTEYVKPICLPVTSEDLTKQYTGEKLFVAGWGKTESRSSSNVKLKLQVPVKENVECKNKYTDASVKLSATHQICAGGERGKDSCRGDSGGPLMAFKPDQEGNVNWISVGVVSFGPTPCGLEGWPGVYVNVANYMKWIVSKMRP